YQGITTAQDINSKLATLYNRDLRGLAAFQEANIDLIYIGRAYRSAILAEDAAEVENYRAEIEKDRNHLNASLDEAEQTLATAEGKRVAAETRATLATFYPAVDEIMKLAAANKDKEAAAQSRKVRLIGNKVDEELSTLVATKEKLGE